MPRSQARIDTAIWDDGDFVALPGSAQRLYLFLLSQPTLQLCGVLPYQPNKWVKKYRGASTEEITTDLATLEDARFIVCDLENDEILVRSLMRNDRVTPRNGKLWKAADDQIKAISSSRLRAALAEEVTRILTECGIDTASIQHPEGGDDLPEGDEMPHGSGIDTPRVRARASALPPPPSDYHPPPSTSGAERFVIAYMRHALQRGGVKNPQALRASVLAKWGPWAEERFRLAPSTTAEHLVDMALALGEPPQLAEARHD